MRESNETVKHLKNLLELHFDFEPVDYKIFGQSKI